MSSYKRVNGDYTIQTLDGNDIVTINSATVSVTGNLTVTGNATLSGNISGDKLFNGTTSIEIQTAGGNANITVGGTSNVAVFSTAGVTITGTESVTGNVIAGNVNTAGQVSVTGNVTSGNLSVTNGNIVLSQTSGATSAQMIRFTDANTAVTTLGANIGSIEWYTNDATGAGPRTTAAIKAVYADNAGNANILIQYGDTASLSTAIAVTGINGFVGISGNVAPAHNLAVNGTTYASGNATVGNLISSGVVSAAGNISAAGNVLGANVVTAGNISAGTGNISGGNVIITTGATAGTGGFSATGNVTGGNVNSNGLMSATGNVYSGGNLLTQGYVSATGNILGAGLQVANANVSGNSYGTGTGVENIVNQASTVAFSSASMANVGTLGFFALAGYTYKFEAYMPVLPDGSTTTGFSTYFDAGTCYYTIEAQTTQTSAFNTSSSNVSGTAAATQSMTGTTPRTVRITGTIYSIGNANVAIQAQTSAANINVQSGSYLTYTRTS